MGILPSIPILWAALPIPLANDLFLLGIVVVFDQMLVEVGHPNANFGHCKHSQDLCWGYMKI